VDRPQGRENSRSDHGERWTQGLSEDSISVSCRRCMAMSTPGFWKYTLFLSDTMEAFREIMALPPKANATAARLKGSPCETVKGTPAPKEKLRLGWPRDTRRYGRRTPTGSTQVAPANAPSEKADGRRVLEIRRLRGFLS